MDVIIKAVSTRKELRQFVLFPYSLYSKNRCWVPPLFLDEVFTLSKQKNPAFENCEATYWLAYKGNEIVGRIAGIINHAFVAKWNRKYARFGWLDFIDDERVSRALLEAVESWALKKGSIAVHGPLGFTDFDAEGLLVDGFDRVGTMTTIYNHPYYSLHLEKFKYKKDVDWVEFEIEIPKVIPSRVNDVADVISKRFNLRVLSVKKAKALLPYAGSVFDLINKSYAHLYGVVPLSPKQIKAYTKQYFSFINPDYVSFVFQEDQLVAFAIAIPSLSIALQNGKGKLFPFGFLHIYKALKKNNLADLYLIAVRPDLQGKGITALIARDLCAKFNKNGILKAMAHPILEQNGKMISFWKGYNRTIVKRRRCYIKVIDQRYDQLL